MVDTPFYWLVKTMGEERLPMKFIFTSDNSKDEAGHLAEKIKFGILSDIWALLKSNFLISTTWKLLNPALSI